MKEVHDPAYRDCDRVVWDEPAVVDWLWARCAAVEGLGDRLAVVEEGDRARGKGWGSRWVFRGLNSRMRFLRYRPGQFFKRKCAWSLLC